MNDSGLSGSHHGDRSMNNYSRILAALLLTGAAGTLSACGGDDKDPYSKPDAGDAGKEKDAEGTDEDAGPGDDEDGGEEDSGSAGDGGSAEEKPKELDECPKHPNVTTVGNLCAISGSLGNEIVVDLELQPVKDKLGYLINKGVFVGQDVGGKATPDASKKKVTLTIGKGTTLYGADALSFLLINRGSKIVAEGTAKYPVVFTSGASGAAKPGRWGGVIINGRAPSNRANADGDVTGEAGTGKYSGPDAADDSGVLKYVRLEFTGGKVDDKNELNGLALQGVGNKTVLDYIHIHAGDDDAIEFFGGTVNAKHLVLTAYADDGIDWTDGWVGKVQFAVAQQWDYTNPGSGTNDAANGIEADNNDQGDFKQSPNSKPTLSNITFVGSPKISAPVGGSGLNLRRGTQAEIANVVVLNFKTSCISLRDPITASYVGDQLTLANSRLYCGTKYQPTSATAPFPDATAAEKLFTASGSNEWLADAEAASLKAPYEQNEKADFTPKAGSSLLTGGKVPSGDFFEDVAFIGAFGEESWIEGDWVKLTTF
jgi:hypothetical protein